MESIFTLISMCVWLGMGLLGLWVLLALRGLLDEPREGVVQPEPLKLPGAGLATAEADHEEVEYDEPGHPSEYLEHYEDNDGRKFDPDGYPL